MRIALLCRSLPLHRQGGLEWHAWDLARGLARRGHRIRILTTPFEKPDKQSALARELARPEFEVIQVGRPSGGRYSFEYFRECARLADGWARGEGIDLVHAQGFAALFLSRGALGRVPLVATIHGTWWSETLLDRRARLGLPGWRQAALLWRFRHRILLQPAYRHLLGAADRLIVDSDFTRGELIRTDATLESKIRAVPLGLDMDRFVAPHASKPPYDGWRPVRLLMLGRLEREKGFDIALRTLWQCRHRNWDLRIGGEGPDRARLETLSQELARTPHAVETLDQRSARASSSSVTFLGRVPDDRLAREFAEADLFLNPDLTQPAFGLVALEAMMQGTPVLASRVGAMPEVLGPHGGWLAPPGDIDAWRDALDDLLSRPESLAAKGCDARADALRRFSLDRMLDGVEAVYRELLQRGA